MSKILIAGGAGFIGSALIRELGVEDILVFDNLSSVVHNRRSISDFLSLGVEFKIGDVSLRDDVISLLDNCAPEVLVYLVAETGTGRSLFNIEMNARVNVLGLALVLDEMSRRERFPQRVVLTSTRAVYGEGPYLRRSDRKIVYPDQRAKADLERGRFEYPDMDPIDMDARDHLTKPISVYGSTKLAQENLLLNWARSFEIPCYGFRLQNVYGAGQSLTNPYTGVLLHFLRRASSGEEVLIYEGGGITRDFVHVDDVARILAAAVRGEGKPGLYDVGSGVRVDLVDVAAELARLSGGCEPKLSGEYRLGDVRHACANISHTSDIFNWTPRMSLADGLAGLYLFFRSRATEP